MYIQYRTITYWHVLHWLAVAESSCVIVVPHRIIKIHLIAEETETVKMIENNIIVQCIMKSDYLTLIPLRIVTVAIRSVLSSIGMIITKITRRFTEAGS